MKWLALLTKSIGEWFLLAPRQTPPKEVRSDTCLFCNAPAFDTSPFACIECMRKLGDSFAPDPSLLPLYDAVFVLGGLTFCEKCKAEPLCNFPHQRFSDAFYHDQALAMLKDGWDPGSTSNGVLCPACFSEGSQLKRV